MLRRTSLDFPILPWGDTTASHAYDIDKDTHKIKFTQNLFTTIFFPEPPKATEKLMLFKGSTN